MNLIYMLQIHCTYNTTVLRGKRSRSEVKVKPLNQGEVELTVLINESDINIAYTMYF